MPKTAGENRPKGFGLCCPICKSNITHVYDSRAAKGEVIRRRECENGHRFRTTETNNGVT